MMRVLLVLAVLAGTARAEDYTVEGEHDLHATVSFERDTGTTHEATRIEIVVGKASLIRVAKDDGPQLPLIGKIVQVTPDRWVLLGWTSYGEGMQTMTAWIVERRGGVRLTDELYWTSDRAHAGIAIEDERGTLRIGVPDKPSEGHNLGDWKLVVGGKTVTKLHGAKTSVRLFAPPTDDARPCECGVTWFAIGERFTRR